MSPTGKILTRMGASLGALVGLWLIISPAVWQRPYPGGASVDGIVVGACLIALMAIKELAPAAGWIGWTALLLGLWVLYSPWAVGFYGKPDAFYNFVLVGIVLIIIASALVLAREGTIQHN